MSTVLDALRAGSDGLSGEMLAQVCGLSYPETMHQLRDAVIAGLIERDEAGCYRLSAQGRGIILAGEPIPVTVPVEAPRIADTRQQRIWLAMRTLSKFTTHTLTTAICQPDESERAVCATIQTYTHLLYAAGYLARYDIKGGPSGRCYRYRLTRDTGYRSPSIRQPLYHQRGLIRAIVCDHNTGDTIAIPCGGQRHVRR